MLCVPLTLGLKLVVHYLPLDYYVRIYQLLVVFWATVTFCLNVGGEVLRETTRATGGAHNYTSHHLLLHPELQNCLDVSHIEYGLSSQGGITCRDSDPVKTMAMKWPWAEAHGCDSLALSAGNVSRFFELQLVVVLLQLHVKAALLHTFLCVAFLALAFHWTGIYDAAGLAHVLGLQLMSGCGVSVVCYLEGRKMRQKFAMAKVAKFVNHRSRQLLYTLIPKNVVHQMGRTRQRQRSLSPSSLSSLSHRPASRGREAHNAPKFALSTPMRSSSRSSSREMLLEDACTMSPSSPQQAASPGSTASTTERSRAGGVRDALAGTADAQGTPDFLSTEIADGTILFCNVSRRRAGAEGGSFRGSSRPQSLSLSLTKEDFGLLSPVQRAIGAVW